MSELPDNPNGTEETKDLTTTQRQERFLDALFGEAHGDPYKAKLIAGYSNTTNTSRIVEALQPQIIARAKQYLSVNLPFACSSLVSIMFDPDQNGAKEKMKAATEIMDRTGLIKTEGVKVDEGSSMLLRLPQKDDRKEV